MSGDAFGRGGRQVDDALARRLGELNSRFYRQVGASFSATRQTGWPGWQRVLGEAGLVAGSRADVLDLACGNLRFERYLAGQSVQARVWAVDNCDELVGLGRAGAGEVRYLHVDVADALFEPGGLRAALAGVDPCDLAVCFGFLHHVALPAHRLELLRALIEAVRPGGMVAVSLWQFARDARLLAKATPVEGGNEGDYLLGWQGSTDVMRYCHSFSEGEVDTLSASCEPVAYELARYSADGRAGDLNRYLILRRGEGCPACGGWA